jgi:hypothetical protein
LVEKGGRWREGEERQGVATDEEGAGCEGATCGGRAGRGGGQMWMRVGERSRKSGAMKEIERERRRLRRESGLGRENDGDGERAC